MVRETTMRRLLFVPVYLLFFLMPDGASGTEGAISLQEAIGAALSANPQLLAIQARRDAALDQHAQARAGMLPQVYFTQSFQRTTNPMWVLGTKLNQGVMTAGDFAPELLNDPDAIDNTCSRFWFLWPLLDAPTFYGWQQADLAREAAVHGHDRAKQETIAQTVAAYADLISAGHQVAVTDKAIDTAETHLKMIEKRFDTGMVVKSDVLRAKVHLAELEQHRAIAKSAAAVARAALNTVMGRDTGEQVSPTDDLAQTQGFLPELPELIDVAVTQRPDLKQAVIQETIAEKELRKARSGHFPALHLNGGYEFNSEDFDDANENYTIGAELTVNLFSGGLITGKSREAANGLLEIRFRKQALVQQIRLETEKAYYDYLSAEARIAASRLAVQNAEETLRIVTNRYETGLLNIVSLLDAELSAYRCQTGYYTALQDQVKARVRLALATGRLDERFQ